MHALMELQMENDAAVAADPSVDKVTYDFFVSTTPAENAVSYTHLDVYKRQVLDGGQQSIEAVGGAVNVISRRGCERFTPRLAQGVANQMCIRDSTTGSFPTSTGSRASAR